MSEIKDSFRSNELFVTSERILYAKVKNGGVFRTLPNIYDVPFSENS